MAGCGRNSPDALREPLALICHISQSGGNRTVAPLDRFGILLIERERASSDADRSNRVDNASYHMSTPVGGLVQDGQDTVSGPVGIGKRTRRTHDHRKLVATQSKNRIGRRRRGDGDCHRLQQAVAGVVPEGVR
jgi:hypothetical protein